MTIQPIWDSHIHLDKYPKERIPYLVDSWRRQGIEGIIAVSMDLKSSYETLELGLKFPDFVYPALGFHPEQLLPQNKELIELERLIIAEQKNIVGIGEVGLIHYRKQELGIQHNGKYEELLEFFARLSESINKPLIIHAVHEEASVALKILQMVGIKKALFHWFKSDAASIQAIQNAGYYISLTPEITFRNRDQIIAKDYPLDLMLLETDGPWPLAEKYHGILTEPTLIKDSIKTLAAIKGISKDDVQNILFNNIKKLYFNNRIK